MNRKSCFRGPRAAGPLAVLLLPLLLGACVLSASDADAPEMPPRSPILLLGDWERYEGYLTDETLAAGPRPFDLVRASLRTPLFSPVEPGGGSATYRLKLTVGGDAEIRDYALFIPALPAYRALLVNGTLLYSSGTDAAPPREIRIPAPESGTAVSIVLQSDPAGPRLESPGIRPSLILAGSARGVEDAGHLLAGFFVFEIGYFFLSGLFLFLLFLFWRKNREFLACALFMFAAAAFTLFKGSSLLGILPPAPGPVDRLYLLAVDLLALGLAAFAAALFPLKARPWQKALLGLLAVLFTASAALPLPLGVLRLASAGFYALLGLAVAARTTVAAFKGDGRARWLLLPLLVLGGSAVASVILPDGFFAAFVAELAGLTVFSFFSMLMLVKKTGDSFESAEALTDYVANVSTTVKRFIPKEFLDFLNKAEITDLQLGDHVKKEMTIFFSDIRAFTELSERLTIEENFAFINSYLARVVPLITERGGFVDKYIGDAIMALFPGEKGPDAAIRAAVAMQEKVVEYNGHRAKMGYRPISMGVGIHTGDLMLGVVGVSDRMENTVISDAVNLASRLQAITKAFNIGLAISEQAFKELEDPGTYKYRFIGKVKVKGKAAPVSVFEIFDGIAPELFERKMHANTFFEQGMLSYYQKDFAGAMYYFKRVLDQIPEDGAAAFYLENCMAKAAL